MPGDGRKYAAAMQIAIDKKLMIWYAEIFPVPLKSALKNSEIILHANAVIIENRKDILNSPVKKSHAEKTAEAEYMTAVMF